MDDKRYIVIGNNIRNLRKKNFYSQEKFAEQIDISSNHLHRIETAKSRISLPLLLKIAEVFEVDVDELFKEEQCIGNEIIKEMESILSKCNDVEKEVVRQTIFNLYHTLRNVGV